MVSWSLWLPRGDLLSGTPLDGGMKQMWVGIKGIMSKRAGKTDKGIAALRAKNGKMVSSSRGNDKY